jgi:hypothetical protein
MVGLPDKRLRLALWASAVDSVFKTASIGSSLPVLRANSRFSGWNSDVLIWRSRQDIDVRPWSDWKICQPPVILDPLVRTFKQDGSLLLNGCIGHFPDPTGLRSSPKLARFWRFEHAGFLPRQQGDQHLSLFAVWRVVDEFDKSLDVSATNELANDLTHAHSPSSFAAYPSQHLKGPFVPDRLSVGEFQAKALIERAPAKFRLHSPPRFNAKDTRVFGRARSVRRSWAGAGG